MDNKSTFGKLRRGNLSKYFRGDGKIFFIVFFVLILLILSGIITELYIKNINENWQQVISQEINEVQKSVIDEFKINQNLLKVTLSKLKNNLTNQLNQSEEVYKSFLHQINKQDYKGFSIEIFAPNGKILGWNTDSKNSSSDLFPLRASIGETFFLETDLLYCFSIIDTFDFQQDEFFILLSLPIEKKYKLSNEYFNEISITNKIVEKIQTEVKIDFNPFTSPFSDGRKFSFELLNNKNKKIGLVTIDKPTLKNRIKEIKAFTSSFQSLIVLFGIMIIGFGLRKDYKRLNSLFAKFTFLLVYLILFRILLFAFSFPAKFLTSPITDPANFSSTFAFGLVKSPLELLVTNIFISIIAFQFFRYSTKYLRENKKIKYRLVSYFLAVLVLTLFPFVLRAFAASMHSVIFDSKLRYFKSFEIIPDFTMLTMQINILLMGVSFVFILVGFIVLLKKFVINDPIEFKIKDFLFLGTITILSTIIFYWVAKNPLYSYTNLLIIVLSILTIFFVVDKYQTKYLRYYLIIVFIASFNSVILLNYFDTQRERESVKNITMEIDRLNSQLIKYYLSENISQIYSEHSEKNILLRKDINFNALAFINWSKSRLHQEELNSFLAIYDRFGRILGAFNVGFLFNENIRNLIGRFNEITFIDDSNNDSLSKKIVAYSKYIEQGVPQLVVASGIDFKVSNLGGIGFPEFLKSNLNIINQYINLEKVKIYQFNNRELVQFYGDVYPNREQIKHLFNIKLDTLFNDGWTKINFGDEKYEAYIFRYLENEKEITNVVAVAENKFSWSLFNFFKVFIIHSLLIFLFTLFYTFMRIRFLVFTFRTKLLLLFLFISIIPLTFLGLYNRDIIDERSLLNIRNDLKQKLYMIENSLKAAIDQGILLNDANMKTHASLNISYNLFKSTDLIYSSGQQYFDIGLLNKKINSDVFYKLNYDKYREVYVTENIENYQYQSFYKIIKLNNQDYILNVNEAINKSSNSISTTDFDIVLFGIYSLTLVIIIVSSTLLANQISSPIYKLTKAAEAVGKGDLSIKIEHKEKGELKELIDGFNKMTDELKKNQIELAKFERESAWKEMAKQVAHEIKNPLTPMKLTLQQLVVTFKERREDFDKLFDKVSSTILNQIENLNHIASEFSRFAKMPSINFEKFDLVQLLNELSGIYQSEKLKILILTYKDEIIIENDKNQMSRIIINLIRNSIQAGANEIKVSVETSINSIDIYFADDGRGINPEYQIKIFDENFTTKKHGMGLGLKIAKKYLNSINGDIMLLSSSNKGTAFKIKIPIKNN